MATLVRRAIGRPILRGPGGKLARGLSCCCKTATLCDRYPSTIFAHINFCGYSMITLEEWLPGFGTPQGPWRHACETFCGFGTAGDSDRFWLGTGQFGGDAADTASIYLVCRDGVLTSLVLACGSISECAWCDQPLLFSFLEWPSGTPLTSGKFTSPFGYHVVGSPEQSCPSLCPDNWEILFTGDTEDPF